MSNERLDISKYRFGCAKDDLDTAWISLEHNKIKNAVNRSYYAIFHAIRAINALEGFDSKKHSGVIAYFNQHFVKIGKFDIGCSKLIESAFRIRNNADYEDFYIIEIAEAQEQYKNAEKFLSVVETYLIDTWEKEERD
jgi:uncharacterized protein (UPF0332 family)